MSGQIAYGIDIVPVTNYPFNVNARFAEINRYVRTRGEGPLPGLIDHVYFRTLHGLAKSLWTTFFVRVYIVTFVKLIW